MTFFYEIAGVKLKVTSSDERMYTDSDVLTPYLSNTQKYDYSFEYKLCDELPAPVEKETVKLGNVRVFSSSDGEQRYYGDITESWQGASLCVALYNDRGEVFIKRGQFTKSITPHHVLDSIMLEHLITLKQGVLLHASFIKWDGRAVLFTAPSGVGKSTQARLWCESENAILVNGDKAAVFKDQICGVPFSGSSGVQLNESAPPCAIVYLTQAKENTIKRLYGREAFVRIWEGCVVNLWNEKDTDIAIKTVNDIISNIPVYQLACTKDGSSVQFLKENL